MEGQRRSRALARASIRAGRRGTSDPDASKGTRLRGTTRCRARGFRCLGAHVAVLDARGRILGVNGAWRHFGLENGGEALAEGCDYFAVCEASAATEPTAAVVVDGLRALVAGTVGEFAVEYPCHSPDQQRWFRLTARRLSEGAQPELLVIHEDVSAIRAAWGSDSVGVVTGMAGVTVDLTERTPTKQQTAQQLRAITDTIGDGVCVLDSRGLVTYVNPPARRMLRRSLAEASGGSFFLWLRHEGGAHPRRAVPTASNGSQPVACQLARPDATELPIEYVPTRLPSANGAIQAGWAVVFRDLSDRRAREDKLAAQVEQVAWLTRIRQALDNDGFVLHAQPIVDIKSGRTVQHELLIRMRDPEQPDVLISPDRFLPTAEALGVAAAIDRWVLARGFEFAAHGYPVEINLSATSLEDATLPYLIEQLLDESGADPANIVFEITETALLDNDVTAQYFADRIHQLGSELALDDFGTGYGGFTYLKHLPLDYLKIDIEFVRDAVTSAASRHVIESVVSLAHAFDLQTIAEGVEDDATLQLLARLDVDFAQGFLLARPASTTTVFPPLERPNP